MIPVSAADNIDISLMLLLGLTSSLHCVGMCGPVIAVASAPLTETRREGSGENWLRLWVWQANYHLGRGITYCVLGALIGLIGTAISNLFPSRVIGASIQAGIGLSLVGFAIYQILRNRSVASLSSGARISLLLRKLITSGHGWGMLGLGLITGFLPCGVLYAALGRCVAASSFWEGAFLMAAFWAGTAPLLLIVGVASGGFFRVLGKYASVFIFATMVTTGGWLIYKGYTNFTLSSPPPCHVENTGIHY